MPGTLKSLSFRNIEGAYYDALEETQKASWMPLIASTFTSTQPHEVYKWFGHAPPIIKFQGRRTLRQLKDYGYTLLNDKFEGGIEVDLDDLTMEKTDQIEKRIQELADGVAVLPQRLLTALIEANGTGYDGSAFFTTTHSVGASGTLSNDITVSGTSTPDAPTTASMSAAIMLAIQQLDTMKNDVGEPMNEFAKEYTVMVPSKYLGPAQGAIAQAFTSAGVSNTLAAMLSGQGFKVNLVRNSRLTGTAAAAGRRFYVFRSDARIRPLIWQELRDWGLRTLSPDSEFAFWEHKVAHSVMYDGNAGYGRFEYACRVNLAA